MFKRKYTYGKVRVPVLAVFSTTVLAQLSAVFLAKEAIERLFHHGHGQSHHAHHDEGTGEANSHDGEDMLLDYYFYLAAFASSTSLLTVAYGVVQQPFNYVLKHASSSMIQVLLFFYKSIYVFDKTSLGTCFRYLSCFMLFYSRTGTNFITTNQFSHGSFFQFSEKSFNSAACRDFFTMRCICSIV